MSIFTISAHGDRRPAGEFRLALPTPFGPQLETDIILPYRVDPAIQRRNSRLLMMSAMRPLLNGQPYSVQVLGRLRSGIRWQPLVRN